MHLDYQNEQFELYAELLLKKIAKQLTISIYTYRFIYSLRFIIPVSLICFVIGA